MSATSHRETDHDYAHVLFRFPCGWRLAECRDGIQWLLQKPRSSSPDSAYVTVRFHRRKDALMRSVHALTGTDEAVLVHLLADLPERLDEAASAARRASFCELQETVT